MSQLKPRFHGKSEFVFRRTKPRKATSRSPFRFSAVDFTRELGNRYRTIDIRIGNQKLILDVTQGIWIPDAVNAPVSDSEDTDASETKERELEEENNLLRAKLDILLEMLAEIIAEEKLQPIQ